MKTVARERIHFRGLLELCDECDRAAERRALLSRLLVAAAVVAVAGAGIAWLVLGKGPLAYGPRSVEIHAARAALEREPCDREAIVKLGDLLVAAGEPREALAAAGAFEKKCGPWPRLWWVTYEAHKRLSESDAAIADATRLIESEPDDKDFWWWRGIVYETRGGRDDLEKAAADYRQALINEPRMGGIPFNLANVLERLGRPCDAIGPLMQYEYWHPDARAHEAVVERVARLSSAGKCELQSGRAVIHFAPRAPVILVDAKLRGPSDGAPPATGRFILDTGASMVAISEALAKRAGVDYDGAPQVTVRTANGVKRARAVVLGRVELQGVSASHVDAAVVDTLGPDVDGLLGLSFLSRFTVRVSQAEGRVELAAEKE